MKTLVFLLEERSAEVMLRNVLPRFLPEDVNLVFITFEGKSDLENNVENKIRGWSRPDSYFVVMRDQDNADCKDVKARLIQKCSNTGKSNILIRIACHELESFYLGDLHAVELAYGKRMPSQRSRKFREPDTLSNAADILKMITQYEYQKIDGSRRISDFLILDGSNRSNSFNVLLSGIKKLLSNQ